GGVRGGKGGGGWIGGAWVDARHLPTASKFSSAKPSGSIRWWQDAHDGFFRCASIRSRSDRGCPSAPASLSAGMSGGGGGGGAPRRFARSHRPRIGSDVRLGYDVTVRRLA